MWLRGARRVDLPSGLLCFDRSTRQARRNRKLVLFRLCFHEEDGCVLRAECTVVTVECQRRPVTHVAGLGVDVVRCNGHDEGIVVDHFALRHIVPAHHLAGHSPRGCVCVSGVQSVPPTAQPLRSSLMGQVVSLAQHQATRQMQIREAERRAEKALLQASAAYKELHRLKGD